eukprot:gnl/Chilomastix_cuspidata/4252.p1 GENE.gnl/Chilomastix_cuspidata/4252~~gnl/Chilomastix_cuspidata/4252.p1  ORF type:complete len:241 (+),score=63.72 gnl/Chilomastix_cuspidata/4252:3141-3863(+)
MGPRVFRKVTEFFDAAVAGAFTDESEIWLQIGSTHMPVSRHEALHLANALADLKAHELRIECSLESLDLAEPFLAALSRSRAKYMNLGLPAPVGSPAVWVDPPLDAFTPLLASRHLDMLRVHISEDGATDAFFEALLGADLRMIKLKTRGDGGWRPSEHQVRLRETITRRDKMPIFERITLRNFAELGARARVLDERTAAFAESVDSRLTALEAQVARISAFLAHAIAIPEAKTFDDSTE